MVSGTRGTADRCHRHRYLDGGPGGMRSAPGPGEDIGRGAGGRRDVSLTMLCQLTLTSAPDFDILTDGPLCQPMSETPPVYIRTKFAKGRTYYQLVEGYRV